MKAETLPKKESQGMAAIRISKNSPNGIVVSFPYDPQLVEKVKTIEGRKWHKDEKYWSFPYSNGTLEKIIEVFKSEELHIDPALLTKNIPLPLRREDKGGFEDLRRELLSRKYSYKTIKGYLYFNKDFLNFIRKNPFEITDTDIKDYLIYLAENKQSATSTLNQAINALKFYYGSMLKKNLSMKLKDPARTRNFLLS